MQNALRPGSAASYHGPTGSPTKPKALACCLAQLNPSIRGASEDSSASFDSGFPAVDCAWLDARTTSLLVGPGLAGPTTLAGRVVREKVYTMLARAVRAVKAGVEQTASKRFLSDPACGTGYDGAGPVDSRTTSWGSITISRPEGNCSLPPAKL